MDRLLKLVERLRQQSQRVRRASTWEAAVKGLNAILLDHIGAPTWRERAWADGPAWQRNAADHVERIVAGLAELDHDGVAVAYSPATLRQVVGTLLDTPVRRRGDAAGAVSIVDIAGAACIDATRVFVVGLNEGVLPASTVDDLLLGRDLPESAAGVIEGPRASPRAPNVRGTRFCVATPTSPPRSPAPICAAVARSIPPRCSPGWSSNITSPMRSGCSRAIR